MFLITKNGPRQERVICKTANDLLDFIIANAPFSYTVEQIEFHEVKASPTGETVTLSDPSALAKLRRPAEAIPLSRSKEPTE